MISTKFKIEPKSSVIESIFLLSNSILDNFAAASISERFILFISVILPDIAKPCEHYFVLDDSGAILKAKIIAYITAKPHITDGIAEPADGAIKYIIPVGKVKVSTPIISQCNALLSFFFFWTELRLTEITSVASKSPK